jgi:hypothetical protein
MSIFEIKKSASPAQLFFIESVIKQYEIVTS